MLFLRLIAMTFLLCAPLTAIAAQLKLKSLQVGSRTYSNVTVLGANATDMYFRHDDGISNVKLKYLNEDLQRRFNYDAQAATEAERQQAEDDARYQVALASNLVAQAHAAALKAKKLAASSSLNLVDVISDKSDIGKPVPDLPNTNWIGAAPALKGKFVVRYFWTPWSIPSRRAIPDLNSLSRIFPDKLAVVGITPESMADIEEMPEPKPEFPMLLDPNARQIAASGITYIPQVLLSDPNGILLYQGHPGALTTNILSSLLTTPATP